MFPERRLRRMRKNAAQRAMRRETRLHGDHLIYPVFVAEGLSQPQPIASLRGISTWPLNQVVASLEKPVRNGLRSVILFGSPAEKDEIGSSAAESDGVVQTAIRNLKRAYGEDLLVMADVCMCQYTDHGHCGIVDGNRVVNDESLAALADIAASYADAGVDWVAPSDMMDGRVGAIREALDEAGHEDVSILSYAVKYASAFYGPFRDAVSSTPQFGDRRSYQMDPGNWREALLEALQDEDEGADALMVKPAGPYLDILRLLRDETDLPLAGYQVSGEYAQLVAADERGWLDFERALYESVLGIRRAGADWIITYGAVQLLDMLRAEKI